MTLRGCLRTRRGFARATLWPFAATEVTLAGLAVAMLHEIFEMGVESIGGIESLLVGVPIEPTIDLITALSAIDRLFLDENPHGAMTYVFWIVRSWPLPSLITCW